MQITIYTQADKIDGVYHIDEQGLLYWDAEKVYKTLQGAKRGLKALNIQDKGTITAAYIRESDDCWRLSYTYDV